MCPPEAVRTPTSSPHAPGAPERDDLGFPDPIPGILPFGTLTVLAGAPGVGKTAMLADWIMRWRTGRTICGKATHAPVGGFWFIAADRQWKSHQIWFDAVGYPDIAHYSIADDPTYDLDRLKFSQHAFATFEACLNQLNPPPGGHLFVDPVSPLFISGDPNRARDVAVSLLRLSRVCQARQLNITCSAHFGKQKSDPKEQYTRPQDRIAGSGAFSGFSDTQIYLIDPVPPAQPFHILGWVPRHAAPEEFHFTRNDHGLFIPYELYTEMDRDKAILACVPEEPTPISAIVEIIQRKLGFSLATIERYLSSLHKQGFILKISRGIYQKAKPN